MPHRVFVSIALAVVLGGTVSAQQRADAPHVPAVDPALARLVPPSPAPGGFIADAPGVLPADARAALNGRIQALQDAGFGDVGVAILGSIEDRTPADVGVAIYRTWRIGRIDGIGSARRNLGVLLLLVPKELAPDGTGHCWITTGTGAEGIVTDAASGSICRDDVIPHMRERDYAAAVGAGLDGIEARLRGDEALAEAEGDGTSDSGDTGFPSLPMTGWLGAIAAGVGGLLGALRWRRRRPRKCPRCGERMWRLDETADDAVIRVGQVVEERVRSMDYDVWECACHERVVLPYKKFFSSFHKCGKCGWRTCRTKRKVVTAATSSRTGVAEDRHRCEACRADWIERVVLPKVTASSRSGSSGGGGGGSFGGSGSSSGGGGGGSY